MSDVTDWIGSLGSAVGAMGTAGALWLGAVVYRRQARDQHRSQAAAVSVGSRMDRTPHLQYWHFIENGSQMPIYDIHLHVLKDGRPVFEEGRPVEERAAVLVSTKSIGFMQQEDGIITQAEFSDSSGTRWRRDSTGKLTELKD
jgi:hypothetical protein